MKPFKILFLFSALLSGLLCTAQPFKVIKATSQNWSGGVVGRHGVIYTFEIEPSSKESIPDTIWINGFVYPLTFSDKPGGYARTTDSVTHKLKYSFKVEEAHNEFRRPPNMPKDTMLEKPKPVRQFSGAAMISYRMKRRQHFFIIKEFTRLQPLNYP